MPRREKPRLSQLENAVMSIVWARGQATAEIVRKELDARQPLKDSTVRTLLRRLETKGYVRHATEGRTYVYSPTSVSRHVAADAVRSLIERLCNGSVEDLLIGMVDREVVSPERLHELARRIVVQKSESAANRPLGARSRKQGK